MTDWSDCVAQVAPQLVHIQTTARSGTGFSLYGSDGGGRIDPAGDHQDQRVPELDLFDVHVRSGRERPPSPDLL